MPRRPDGEALKQAIVAASREMHRSGLSPGRSGNISARFLDGMLITASGVPPESLNVSTDVVFVGADGQWDAEAKLPSSEWRFHKIVYDTRREIGGMVHCHSRFATALACAHKPIPAFHYMVAKAGGSDIPLAPYATYGTQELAALVATALSDRNACLMANHGQIAVGETLDDAVELAAEVECLAAQYVTACAIGMPALLPEEEMNRVAARFKTYGKNANPPKKRLTKTAR